VADALVAGGIKAPIRVMPHPVSLGVARPARDRARWSLPADGFSILVMADFRSSATRKNIDGAIEIVRRASALGSKATLILKMRQANTAHVAHLRQRLEDHVDLRIMTDELDHAGTLSLLASVDVLLSPHRSEGFGLALAEAFLAGTPALATGWSGNMEFMSGLAPLLIDYQLAPVSDPTGIYKGASQSWAEPSLDDAVQKLRNLAAFRSQRHDLAKRGAEAVEAKSAAWNRQQLAATAAMQRT
jgi:glycosyltransferase involved in cell wall biosynthesis